MALLIGIETSTARCAVALGNGNSIEELYEERPREHHAVILPMVAELLHRSGRSLRELDAVAFGCGPGSFTGLRIAASIAQGLGFGAGLPVIAVPSLDALAGDADDLGREAHDMSRILVAVDAHMGEIYWGVYERDAYGCAALLSDQLSHVDEFSASDHCEPGSTIFAGNAWSAYPRILPEGATLFASAAPTAREVVRLAGLADTGSWRAAEDAEPVYLRGVSVWKKLAEQPARS